MSASNGTPVVRGESPPFPELLGFKPVELNGPARPATLVDRWSNLKPRTQLAAIAASVAVLAGGALALTPGPSAELVVVSESVPSPPQPPLPPKIETLHVEQLLPRYYVTVKEVPQNTLVTDENLAVFFRQVEVKNAPDGSVIEERTILGKYTQRVLNASQFVQSRDFSFRPVEEPQQIVVERRPEAVHEYTITDTKLGSRLVRYEKWDGRWKLVTE